ncbi:MAG: ferric reductase-like transmembrane domain-containing protein [Alphaproteobacteria bacterium]|nr:ferric reductase-like transmembrane domain-containing protein [Alphaproteobacteria bacterium]
MSTETAIARPSVRGMPALVLVLLYVALTFGPAFAASLIGDANAPTYWSLLGRVSGIAALAMFLMQFVTSGRYETISGRIGLDRSMSFHRVAAYGAILMVAVHVTAFVLRGRAVWSFDRLWERFVAYLVDPAMLTGVVSIALALVLMPIAIFLRRGPLPYAWWRVLHGLLALAVGGFALHHSIDNARYFADPYGSTAIYALAFIAGLALGVVYLVRPFLAFRFGYRVTSVRDLSPSITELVLDAPGTSRFRFEAGQFVWMTVDGKHTITDNPFSIASAPAELPRLRFLIRKAGDMTRAVVGLKPGTRIGIDGPHGSFTLAEGGSGPLVLIAGGIGIAPVLSLLRHLVASGDTRLVRLLVTARTPADHVARAEIEAMAAGRDMKTLLLVKEDVGTGFEIGRCERKNVENILDGIDRSAATAFVCGSPRIMDTAVGHLLDLGLKPGHVVMERFDYDGAHDAISSALRRRLVALLTAVFIGVAALAWFVFSPENSGSGGHQDGETIVTDNNQRGSAGRGGGQGWGRPGNGEPHED